MKHLYVYVFENIELHIFHAAPVKEQADNYDFYKEHLSKRSNSETRYVFSTIPRKYETSNGKLK